MDDKLYNQIFLKPRFQMDFEMNANNLLNKLKDYIRTEERYKMKVVDQHIVIDIPEKDNHYWSPQLQIEVEELTENTSKLKGLFGPKPQVWTLFMFIHFAVATAFLIFAIIAYSNWSLNKSYFFPVVMLIALPILWILLYFIGSIGKSTGEKQMNELKSFMKQVLKQL
ncbi:GTP-binding protein [Tenacibaculum xiamenense]|uniref:GTP-binding protein n=1 Tax=Tenacibaculum xiamenense TaxID=1261553 RepID=UPI00389490DA